MGIGSSAPAIMFPNVMMLTTGVHVAHRSSPPARILCLASRTDTDQLRDQLDQLHFEASNTRAKANKARQRLLRLSEAAEKLKRQAAISVQAGKENEARDLLYQKKKTMQALENTKTRIELLDELSTKLFEAIALRERELVGTVGQDSEIEKEDDESPVRVVSPPLQNLEIHENSENSFLNSSDDQEMEESLQVPVEFLTRGVDNKNDLVSSLRGLTSYEDFLDRVDQHLNEVEDELVTVVKFSTLVLENKEKPTNRKVQQLLEILDAVQNIRERIAVIMHTDTEMK